MDPFRTKVVIPVSPVKITYHTKCLFMGSCFSDYIGKIMAGYKFPLLINPFGTLFNPASIADNLQTLLQGGQFNHNDLLQYNELWFSFSHYTAFSHPDQEVCLTHINKETAYAADWLRETRYIVITFGTARAYKYNLTGKLVANCHKLPSSEFTQILLQPSDIIARYNKLLSEIKTSCPQARVIFTLSPVRHWSDGAVNNQLSKSILHYSIQEILKNHKQAHYFPSYEIFMDELRDYRFYAEDMLHTSEQGTRYVWDRFCDTWVDADSKKIMADVSAVAKAAGHRPFHSGTITYKKFKQNTLKKIKELTNTYPFLDFSREINSLQ
jgi:hypothetical protein